MLKQNKKQQIKEVEEKSAELKDKREKLERIKKRSATIFRIEDGKLPTLGDIMKQFREWEKALDELNLPKTIQYKFMREWIKEENPLLKPLLKRTLKAFIKKEEIEITPSPSPKDIVRLTERASKHIRRELKILANDIPGFYERIDNIRKKFGFSALNIKTDLPVGQGFEQERYFILLPEHSAFFHILTEQKRKELKQILNQFTNTLATSKKYFNPYYVWLLNHLFYKRSFFFQEINRATIPAQNFDPITGKVFKPLTADGKTLWKKTMKLRRKKYPLTGWQFFCSLSLKEQKKLRAKFSKPEDAIKHVMNQQLQETSHQRVFDYEKGKAALEAEPERDWDGSIVKPVPCEIRQRKKEMRKRIEEVKQKYKRIETLPRWES